MSAEQQPGQAGAAVAVIVRAAMATKRVPLLVFLLFGRRVGQQSRLHRSNIFGCRLAGMITKNRHCHTSVCNSAMNHASRGGGSYHVQKSLVVCRHDGDVRFKYASLVSTASMRGTGDAFIQRARRMDNNHTVLKFFIGYQKLIVIVIVGRRDLRLGSWHPPQQRHLPLACA
jgi:hypothetical protein